MDNQINIVYSYEFRRFYGRKRSTHLIDNQGVVGKEIPATDDGKIGKQVTKSFHSVHTVDDEEVGDLPQLRKADLGDLLRRGVRVRSDVRHLDVPFHDGAILVRRRLAHLRPVDLDVPAN